MKRFGRAGAVTMSTAAIGRLGLLCFEQRERFRRRGASFVNFAAVTAAATALLGPVVVSAAGR
jgi:hypothetical protein